MALVSVTRFVQSAHVGQIGGGGTVTRWGGGRAASMRTIGGLQQHVAASKLSCTQLDTPRSSRHQVLACCCWCSENMRNLQYGGGGCSSKQRLQSTLAKSCFSVEDLRVPVTASDTPEPRRVGLSPLRPEHLPRRHRRYPSRAVVNRVRVSLYQYEVQIVQTLLAA